jgi:hypothetical protein
MRVRPQTDVTAGSPPAQLRAHTGAFGRGQRHARRTVSTGHTGATHVKWTARHAGPLALWGSLIAQLSMGGSGDRDLLIAINSPPVESPKLKLG